MIHELPICFDCNERIERLDEAIFASPWYDEDPQAPTACFHGLCLMRWRERRDELIARIKDFQERLELHFRGECPDCQLPEEGVG